MRRRGVPEVGDVAFSPYDANLNRNNLYVSRIFRENNVEMAQLSGFVWGHVGKPLPLSKVSFVYRPKGAKFMPGAEVRNMLSFGKVIEVRERISYGNVGYYYWVTWCDELIPEKELWADD